MSYTAILAYGFGFLVAAYFLLWGALLLFAPMKYGYGEVPETEDSHSSRTTLAVCGVICFTFGIFFFWTLVRSLPRHHF